MKHNEQARVAPLDFLKILFVHRIKLNAHTTRTPPGLVFCSLTRCGRPFWARSLALLVLILVLAL